MAQLVQGRRALKTVGSFEQGQLSGLWRGWFPNGQAEYEGSWQADLKHGPWKLYYENGRTQEEGSYAEGRKTGRWTSFNTHGTIISEGAFVEGEPSGPWTYYDDAGVKMREQGFPERQAARPLQGVRPARPPGAGDDVPRGPPHGTMTIYDSGGNVAKRMEYEDGRMKKDLPPAMKDEPRPASVPGMDRKR